MIYRLKERKKRTKESKKEKLSIMSTDAELVSGILAPIPTAQ